ncbi:hypothetical protein GCM10009738_43650 [Kitasatospora viridis]
MREVLDRAERVVIVEGAPDEADSADRPRTVVTGTDIAELARLLAIVDGGTGDRCRCLGWPTILVHGTDGELIARWTLHHQTGLRGAGNCDADLLDGPALTDWLAGRGLTGSRKAQAALAAQRAEADQRQLRWIEAAPAGLTDAAAAVTRSIGSPHLREAEDQLAALLRQRHPDAIERIRVLLAWSGTAAREPNGGLMWYDMALQRQLLTEDPDSIRTAPTTRPPTPAQLDGAAQLFSSLDWTDAHGKDLPEPLRSLLIAHIEADGTDVMRFCLRHGYYGAERSV